MTKKELVVLLDQLEIRPSRKLGQNFLVDTNLLNAIVRDAAPAPGENILEVGPGTGVLTRKLLEAGARVTSVEIDHRLAAYLREAFADQDTFRLIEADACKQNYDDVMGEAPYRCIANLPYASSSVLLAKMTELRNAPVDMFVLLQREMADRLGASPGTKQYGALSVTIGLCYSVKQLRSIPPNVFFPPPEVDSCLVRLCRHETAYPLCERELAHQLARIGFSQRRKKMLNLICKSFDRAVVTAAFARLGLSPDLRAEQLPVAGFVELAACLSEN